MRLGVAYDDVGVQQVYLENPRKVRWWLVETLGHTESLVGAVVAHRMKGKRRHWSSLGMQNMGKVLQVVRNQELGHGVLASLTRPSSPPYPPNPLAVPAPHIAATPAPGSRPVCLSCTGPFLPTPTSSAYAA